MDKHNFKKQFPINIFSNLVFFALNILIGIWLIPYLIKRLGVAVYGLVPLALSINEYMSVATTSFNSAVARFLTIELQKKDDGEANRIFNTALWSSLFFLLFILPFVIAGIVFSPRIFNIPPGYEYASQIFFMAMVGVFYVYVLNSNFSISSFAFNRFDLRNIVRCSDVAIRALAIILLFSLLSARLWFVGIAYLGGALAALTGSIYFWRKLTPALKIRFSSFDKHRLGDITHMSGWVLIDQIGTVLFLSTELILVNKLCGSEAAGQYAVIFPWVILLRAMVDMVSSTLTPMYFTYYAKREIENIVVLLKKSIKFLGLALAAPIGAICGFAPSLLSIWVGKNFAGLSPLMWLLIGHLIVSLAIMPVFAIQVTFKKVHLPAIVTLLMGMTGIIMAPFFVQKLGWGMYGVAFSMVTAYLLRNICFSSLYVAKILNVKWYVFLVSLVPGILSMLAVSAISFILNYFLKPKDWSELIFCGGMVCVIYLLVAARLILTHEDREILLSLIPTRRNSFV
jgi:membrane protein EpsK